MDQHRAVGELAAQSTGERGLSSVQFVLAAALALILFLALANLVVVQYGKGAIRSALEQGARAGTTSDVNACEERATQVIEDLLGGRMSHGLVLSCSVSAEMVVASATAVFESWTPLTPDFAFTLSSSAVLEP